MLGIMPFEVQRVFVCYFCCHIKEKSSISIPWISESCIKIKINVDFYFHTSLWCLERFYEGLQGLHKTFWGTTKKCETKTFKLIFPPLSGFGTGRVNLISYVVCYIHFENITKFIVNISILFGNLTFEFYLDYRGVFRTQPCICGRTF